MDDKTKVEMLLEDNYFCGLSCIDSNHPKWEKALNRCWYPCEIICQACWYIMNKSRDKIQRESSKKKSSGTQNCKSRNQPNEIFLLEDVVQYVHSPTRRSGRKIECDCWEVRGHYRHYKNGKVVFIRNYIKGSNKESGSLRNKNYVLEKTGGRNGKIN